MNVDFLDTLTIAGYLLAILAAGLWKGRGKRQSAAQYFVSQGTLPWWVIGMAFVATGMNTEQLIGQNGMAYKIGLPLVSIYAIAFAVYSLLIFVFLPVYLRNGILTMPDYLRRRFPGPSADLFTVLLLLSYVFLNLAVVFYGGAKLLEVVMGLDLWHGVVLLAVVAGLYTMYGRDGRGLLRGRAAIPDDLRGWRRALRTGLPASAPRLERRGCRSPLRLSYDQAAGLRGAPLAGHARQPARAATLLLLHQPVACPTLLWREDPLGRQDGHPPSRLLRPAAPFH
jgi:hypothetical protein